MSDAVLVTGGAGYDGSHTVRQLVAKLIDHHGVEAAVQGGRNNGR